jgi:uncharacterized protein YxeA
MKTWIFVIILIGMITGAAAYYYNATERRYNALLQVNSALVENNSTLTSNNLQLRRANEENLNTIDELNSSFEEVRRNYERVQAEFQEIRRQNNRLAERLGRHEIGTLAANRPGLVERAINGASDNVLRCFEVLSGAPLNQRELDAETPLRANPECPWLFEIDKG